MAASIAHYEADGATVLTDKTLADLLAGTTGSPLKFGIKNNGDRALGPTFQGAIIEIIGSDGYTRFRVKKDTGTVSPPWGLEAELSAGSGVWASTGTKGYVVTALNATGETLASDEVTVVVTAVTQRVTLTWEASPGATTYKVYRTSTPGSYAGSVLVPTSPGAGTTLLDDGTATVAGAPPVANTTGGAAPAYGTPPAGLDTSAAPFLPGSTPGVLAIGEWSFYWVNRVVPPNSLEAGNPRTCQVRFSEV